MIQYSFAKTQTGLTVDIKDLFSDNDYKSEIFLCRGCGKELRPRFPKQRAKHFYHKVLPDEILCNGQTYLHLTSIDVLFDTIKHHIDNYKPLMIQTPAEVFCKNCHFPEYHMKSNCFIGFSNFDLLERYNIVEKEKTDGNFQPDILLSNSSGDKIYIEITVTHGVEDDKISSGIKIIEIFMKEESQLRVLKTDDAFTSNLIEIKFHNFNEPEYKEIKPEQCKEKIVAFVVYSSGKSLLRNFNMTDLLKNKNSIVKVKPFDEAISNLLFDTYNGFTNNLEISKKSISEIETACQEGINIKSCHLCLYHSYTQNDFGLNHKFTCSKNNNAFMKSNDASQCEFFSVCKDSFYTVQSEIFEMQLQKENERILKESKHKEKIEIEKNKLKMAEEDARVQKIISETIIKFIVFYDGSAVFLSEHKDDNKLEADGRNIIYSTKTEIPIHHFDASLRGSWRFSEEYISEVIKAKKKGILLKNCYLCQNHIQSKNTENGRIILTCSLNSVRIQEPNNAKSCENYSTLII